MKKKVIALFMTGAMALTMAACGGSSSSSSASSTSSESTEASISSSASSTSDKSTASAASSVDTSDVDYSKVKAGFITLHDENSTYDKNFIDAAKAACESLGVEYVFKNNVAENQEAYDAACELADEGCNFIFADSFNHESYVMEAAQEYPDVQFCHATGTQAHTANLDNFHDAFASIYEGRYLAGITAGMKLNEMIDEGKITEDEAKMGYVGAYTYAEVISGYTSFYLGAKSVCPSVTMEVTFTGSWYDETAEKEGANKLISDGCVLISQHADSMGAPTACEEAGVPNVSYNGSTFDSCPNTYLVSSKINWQPYFEYAMTCVATGENIDVDYVGTIESGSVELTEYGTAIADGTEEAVEEAKAKLEDGSLHVFDTSTFTVDGKQLTSYEADIDTDADYTPDHQVIIDGYFAESDPEFRSAPYFNIQIDGITLLDNAY